MSFWHSHQWKISALHQIQQVALWPNGQQTDLPITHVLLVCRCGMVSTQCLEGHWDMEQLVSRRGPDADREFFKKLGVKL